MNLYPTSLPLRRGSIIAPFWADLDLTNISDSAVWYNQYSTNPAMSEEVSQIFNLSTKLVRDNIGDAGFMPSNIVKITWQNVAPYSSHSSGPVEVRVFPKNYITV